MRAENCMLAIILTCSGLSSGGTALRVPSLLGCAAIACVMAAANAYNDIRDVVADSLFKAHRPIPSGRVSIRAASTVAGSAAITALLLSTAISWPCLAYIAGALVLSWLYSRYLKAMPFVGNLVVAAVAGSSVWFGSLVAGRPGDSAAPILMSLLVGVGILAVETAKTMEDQIGDAYAGYRTLAHVLSGSQQRTYLRLLTAEYLGACLSLVPVTGVGGLSLSLVGILVLPAVPLTLVSRDDCSTVRIQKCLKACKLLWPLAAVSLLGIANL
jgi:geranylgeranylglycerol-phosphate geranylgeranyltransferase